MEMIQKAKVHSFSNSTTSLKVYLQLSNSFEDILDFVIFSNFM
jgi:hypothetical protein